MITSSTNLSEDEINQRVKEAEQYAEQDKQKKEEIETRNTADQMVYTTEKTLADLGDKLDAGEKADLESKKEALKEALKGTDTAAIKAKSEELQKAMYAVSEKVYAAAQQAAAAQGGDAGANGAPNGGDGYVDADFKEV